MDDGGFVACLMPTYDADQLFITTMFFIKGETIKWII